MDEDEDDMYGSEAEEKPKVEAVAQMPSTTKDDAMEEEQDDAESESEEEESDSDIEIVTEAKLGAKPDPSSQSARVGSLRGNDAVPIKPESPAPGTKPTQTSAIRSEASQKRPTPPPQKPGSSYPAIRSSTLDLDAKPIHDASGKPVTELDMDADFGEDDKPWRRPGSDQTDYFNYGFDEFTWASYCLKQDSLRKEAKDQKKQLEDMQNFMGMGGGAAPNAAPTMPGMPGMSVGGDMPPEMQQMMQQMMSQGMDPTQMDFNQFVQMMGPGAGQQGMQQGYGQQGGQQQMGGYGYGGGGGHSGHGGHGGRGGRGRGRW